jgi:hypothetical protein
MVSSKVYLQRLNEKRKPRTAVHKMFKASATAIVNNVNDLVKLDAPLPISQLARYLSVVCLSGINACVGAEQRDWIRLLNMIMRTEVQARSQDAKDSEDTVRLKVAQVEKILEAASNYQRFTDAQYEAYESDNGDERPSEGEANTAGTSP